MAKFPTEVERTIEVGVPPERAYQFMWDVVGSAKCIPGIDRCDKVGADTYGFVYQARSAGPVSMVVRYTARYATNGKDEITYKTIAVDRDNTDAEGTIRIAPAGAGSRITLRQRVAPDTPVPRIVQGMIRSFVEREAVKAVDDYLANVKRALEKRG
jgi:carbon monoxide dehydrogenase subunit G